MSSEFSREVILFSDGPQHLFFPYGHFTRAKSHFLTKPYRNQLIAKLFRQLVKPADPEKWVFIVGCYNSGTTLLEQMLATHPSISALDEGVFKTDQLITPEELGWTRMWCKVVDQVRLAAQDQSLDIRKLKKDWAVFFDNQKPVFLEKSIVNSARMPWLQENFENSYFIFIVRNGYAVAEGIRRKTLKGKWKLPTKFSQGYPIELCANQWLVTNETVEQDSQAIRNFKMIRYEDLCMAPHEIIKELWDFIGLKEGPNWSENKKWSIQEKQSEIRNMNERSFANLSLEDIERIESVARKMLERYGYSLLSEESRCGARPVSEE